ncbi:MAG: hypothetical protein DI533_00405 [Cereibacter sphaeroides]|uniref:Phage major capsid protein n=1 Tax=Cereibacter sphaeroides TaxID=1063 RepID=A0A2W5SHF6_CERSP|nr:MAG: hypothetical protein DI533_00405 [Cereibacter sphaeroides]
MPHTLPEYAKTVTDDKSRAVIELFPEASDILGVMPFKSAPGGRYGYMREGALPANMAFRAINETPTEGYGVINDLTEQCFPIAGHLDVDRVLINRFGEGRRAAQEGMEIKKKAKVLTDTIMNGDNASSPREFTGLKQRLRAVGSGNTSVDGSNYESRILANAVGSGGAAPSLAMLDIAISLVTDPTHILMPKMLKDRLGAATRDTGVSGFFTQDRDALGKPIDRYNGIPILTGYGITPFGAFLPFNEVAFGGGSAVTASIYILSFAEMGVCGLETSPMEVTDMGLLNNGVHYRTNIEHDVGMCMETPYSALRMTSITNAAWVK